MSEALVSNSSRPPRVCWTRCLGTPPPLPSVHTFSRPPILEALSLLGVAYRVGSYIYNERREGREPIFDLAGIMLEPPNPGPYGGVPLGGLGGGSICVGYRGDFRRWSLHPGRYIHRHVEANQFYLRVKRGQEIFTQVLSVFPQKDSSCSPLEASNVAYHALFPRAWTVFEEPVPGVRVTLRQVSPVIPHSYSDASVPSCVFHVEVENLWPREHDNQGAAAAGEVGDGEIEASVMFIFHNGTDNDATDANGGLVHCPFQVESVKGICMTSSSATSAASSSSSSSPAGSRDVGSFAIATCEDEQCGQDGEAGQAREKVETEAALGRASFYSQFVITGGGSEKSASVCACCDCRRKSDPSSPRKTNDGPCEAKPNTEAVLGMFHLTGDLTHFETLSSSSSSRNDNMRAKTSMRGDKVAAAICLQRVGITKQKPKTFSFALSWDNPVARFGSGSSVPRYYTRFFGSQGSNAAAISTYSLQMASSWESKIVRWQEDTMLQARKNALGPVPEYFDHQLFNELYYLVDGGTIWSDTCEGTSNQFEQVQEGEQKARGVQQRSEEQTMTMREKQSFLDKILTSSACTTSTSQGQGSTSLVVGEDLDLERDMHNLSSNASLSTFRQLSLDMQTHDEAVHSSESLGDPKLVGQFLYLEGHEYLMYNTYDVHFYAGFSLFALWPHLEFSLQRDFASNVFAEDGQTRVMMGGGEMSPRKVVGAVPHDLGSPSDAPWVKTNAYNFQDVSNWKDLGPKFVLQIYRDCLFQQQQQEEDVAGSSSSSTLPSRNQRFVDDMYQSIIAVMNSCEQFDTDGDGMIENSGFPDQTYDIWTAKGVHAYCGGLWIAACYAASEMALIMDDASRAKHFLSLAQRARNVYITVLWNGKYLNYDSSSSRHHDSIMADMLAGQWWARVCKLSPVVTPVQALSCFRTIFELNVMRFSEIASTTSVTAPSPSFSSSASQGQRTRTLWGAVNGMRPNGEIDDCCLQSREVWTGTTYALAAAMLCEAREPSMHISQSEDQQRDTFAGMASVEDDKLTLGVPPSSSSTHGFSGSASVDLCEVSLLHNESSPRPVGSIDTANRDGKAQGVVDTAGDETLNDSRCLTHDERCELHRMAFITAQGIHDAGWQTLGYWFATPEGWEASGNYRSLGYMRPLSIWAMHHKTGGKE